jgi:hypothetical protein
MRLALSSLLLAATLTWPAAAAPELLAAGTAATPLRLRIDAAGARVEGGTADERIALPAGGNLDSFVALREGWLAAGSVPVTGGRELALWRSAGKSAARALAPPPWRSGAVRAFPVPLVDAGRLVGLAWLEGEAVDRFAIVASGFDGERWDDPVVVAPPGPGSQLALAATVLDDGSWLLAWSAFDGEDDEVVWSRRARGGRFSAPRPVAAGNTVPDVTPALRADGGGALLAWSRYDGNDYRLVMTRFAAGRWSDPEWAAGAGTLQPRWQGDALTFRDAARGAWVAASVDALDRLRVESTAPSPAEPRPVAAREAGGLRLIFP